MTTQITEAFTGKLSHFRAVIAIIGALTILGLMIGCGLHFTAHKEFEEDIPVCVDFSIPTEGNISTTISDGCYLDFDGTYHSGFKFKYSHAVPHYPATVDGIGGCMLNIFLVGGGGRRGTGHVCQFFKQITGTTKLTIKTGGGGENSTVTASNGDGKLLWWVTAGAGRDGRHGRASKTNLSHIRMKIFSLFRLSDKEGGGGGGIGINDDFGPPHDPDTSGHGYGAGGDDGPGLPGIIVMEATEPEPMKKSVRSVRDVDNHAEIEDAEDDGLIPEGEPAALEVDSGFTIRLACNVEKLPGIKIVWRKTDGLSTTIANGTMVSPEYKDRATVFVDEGGSTLQIEKAEAKDAGQYTCSSGGRGDRPLVTHRVTVENTAGWSSRTQSRRGLLHQLSRPFSSPGGSKDQY